jgi:hypothetical protein
VQQIDSLGRGQVVRVLPPGTSEEERASWRQIDARIWLGDAAAEAIRKIEGKSEKK